MAKTDFKNIEEYIDAFPEDIQGKLEQIRQTIRKAAPEAKEVISYQMPTFRLNGILVHFAAFTNHISFFPTPSAIVEFQEELTTYETSKGTVKFPHVKSIPYKLITEIVEFRVKENQNAEKINNAKESEHYEH